MNVRRLHVLAALAGLLPAAASLHATLDNPRDASKRVLDAHAALASSTAGFLHSAECAVCHANSPTAQAMRDAAGNPIGMHDLWQGTMMANSARDPFWRAVVAHERAVTPARSAEIAAKCTRCHAPMASVDNASDTEYLLTPERLDVPDPLADLGLDGVSCSVCHQIDPANLGTPASYSGGMDFDRNDQIYGPHQNLIGGTMINFTGKIPVTGPHVLESALCGSCHTLFTDTLRPDGVATGHVLPEQTPYLEWRNSDYQNEVAPAGSRAATCQDCHVKKVDDLGNPITSKVARSPGGMDWPWLPQRTPYGRHMFVGGNTLLPAILRDHAAELGVPAPAAAFDATIAAARVQLQQSTATLTLPSVARSGDDLVVRTRVENRAGHKFPTGFPSRRAWLRLRVFDASNRAVFDCGGFDAEGRLLDGAGNVLAAEAVGGPDLPHRDVVTAPDQPVVWEALMADENGTTTFTLLRGASYGKDNRLLPHGWSRTHPEAANTAPAGVGGDPNFAAGGDEVTFRVRAPAVNGPYRIEAEVLYQPISARWAAELFTTTHPDVQRFQRYWNAANKAPERVATVTTTAN